MNYWILKFQLGGNCDFQALAVVGFWQFVSFLNIQIYSLMVSEELASILTLMINTLWLGFIKMGCWVIKDSLR